MKFVALLRGINVGGKNIIKMADLKTCFQNMGLEQVVTYIQSGNVLFSTTESDVQALTLSIEKKLSEQFDYQAKLVLVSYQQLHNIVVDAPANFGHRADEYRYNVLFLRPSLLASDAVKAVSLRAEVDEVWAGEAVLYHSLLISRASQSHVTRIIKLPIYAEMTIRNWNTTTKLLALMDKME